MHCKQGGIRIVVSNRPCRCRPRPHLKPSQTISNHLKHLKLSQTAPPTSSAPPVCAVAISNCLGQTSAPPSSISKSPRSARPLCARDPLSQIDLTLYLKSTGPSQIQPAPPLSTYHHLKLATLRTPYYPPLVKLKAVRLDWRHLAMAAASRDDRRHAHARRCSSTSQHASQSSLTARAERAEPAVRPDPLESSL